MKLPKYLKCLVNVPMTSPPMMMAAISSALSYTSSSLLHLDSLLSLLGLVARGSEEDSMCMGESYANLKCPDGGNKTHSVFESLSLLPTCISRPNLMRWSMTRMVQISVYILDSKANTPLYAYIIQYSSNNEPCLKLWQGWLARCPIKWGEFICLLNLGLCSPCGIHYFSNVLVTSMMMNKSSIWAMLSPCFTPTCNCIEVYILPITSLTTMSLYIHSVIDYSADRHPYQPKISTISLWLDVSNDVTRSTKITHVGKLWLNHQRSSVLMIQP